MSLDFGYALSCIQPILRKLPITMYMTLLAVLLALVVGTVFALFIRGRVPVFAQISTALCSFLKGVPVLVMLYVVYYAMPDILTTLGIPYDLRNPPKMLFAVTAFGLSYAPYMSDMLISAFDTVPRGQMEACMSLGFTHFQAMRRIIAPQMVVVATPVFGNHFVNLLKMTSLAYMVTIVEMMGAAKNYATGNQMFLETYIVAALLFWIVCVLFDYAFARIEVRLGKFRSKMLPADAPVKKTGIFTLMTGIGR